MLGGLFNNKLINLIFLLILFIFFLQKINPTIILFIIFTGLLTMFYRYFNRNIINNIVKRVVHFIETLYQKNKFEVKRSFVILKDFFFAIRTFVFYINTFFLVYFEDPATYKFTRVSIEKNYFFFLYNEMHATLVRVYYFAPLDDE